jgi:hypothetical protein
MLGNAATASQITHTSATLDSDVARVMEDLHPRLFRYARFRLERPEAEDRDLCRHGAHVADPAQLSAAAGAP